MFFDVISVFLSDIFAIMLLAAAITPPMMRMLVSVEPSHRVVSVGLHYKKVFFYFRLLLVGAVFTW